MKPQEAIVILISLLERMVNLNKILVGGFDDEVEALKIAIESTDKQVDDKPFDHGERCPRCKEIFQDNYGTEDEHCRLCGKKLDWSVE